MAINTHRYWDSMNDFNLIMDRGGIVDPDDYDDFANLMGTYDDHRTWSLVKGPAVAFAGIGWAIALLTYFLYKR
jgi:hypothetical protein